MISRISFYTVILCLAIVVAACGGTESPKNSNTNGSANSVANANSQSAPNSGLDPSRTPEPPTANNAPTLSPVVLTYYDALKKKDDALLKSVMSDSFIKSVEEDMKAEKRTGMAEFMAEFDTIPEKPVEVRNERIEGINGVAELKGGAYINWTPFAFINEGGKWKFTGGSPVLK